jgi:hypothetical protein
VVLNPLTEALLLVSEPDTVPQLMCEGVAMLVVHKTRAPEGVILSTLTAL